MKVLVTEAEGFIGSHLTEALLAEGYNVRALTQYDSFNYWGWLKDIKPITNVFPKALIPIGRETILEQIIDSFLKYKCENFYISVNYKSDMIKYYLNSLNIRNYNIHFIEEKEFLGTARSIKLASQYIESTFFVSSCDILIDDDYANILDFHRESNNEMTIVAAIMQLRIPYGVLETNDEGQLIEINEKPILYINKDY